MPRSSAGLAFIVAGIVLVGVGLLVLIGGFSWFGRLPGDIRVERPTTRVYIPLTSSLLVSVLVSVALFLVGVVMRRFR